MKLWLLLRVLFFLGAFADGFQSASRTISASTSFRRSRQHTTTSCVSATRDTCANLRQSISNSDVQESSSSSLSSLSHNENSFWGSIRTKEEIRRHCANIIFPNEEYSHIKERIEVISAELPLITIDNFLSDEMCNDIIQAANESNKLARSTMGANQELSTSRTSSTLWLREQECEIPLRVLAGKVSRLIGVDASHMENLQVIRYEEGQKFETHTDHLDSFNDLDCRGRLATCLFYLNSSTESSSIDGVGSFDGGSTYFPEYDAHVIPKGGKAVFWFNTIERPGSLGYTQEMALNVDPRSRHSGEPVYNGEKWACNRWIHPVPLHMGVRDDTGLDMSGTS
jgi:prolyl 4-hydroxylase